MCLFSEKWVSKQVLNDHNLLCSLQCKKTFWSFDDNVKSSVITEKDNTYFVMNYHEHIWFHQCQEDINSLYHFERIPENISGAYVSLESEIIRYIKYHVNPETDRIKIRISGDGSNFRKLFFTIRGSNFFIYWSYIIYKATVRIFQTVKFIWQILVVC
jgi:hypothetical protein